MLNIHTVFILLVVLFIITVTVGEDLEKLLSRIADLFHPTDRALRRARKHVHVRSYD
jgi:hypothetical protein